ncbi:MAG: Ig-like domain-containing protein, partial [Bacteroidota bacterium]
MQQSTRIISLALVLFVSIFSSQKTFAQTETLNTGSFIIDMGAQTPTVANTLKPFGLIYDLLKNYNVPVKRVINSSKTKDGIDFTHNGKNFRGGPFIIPAEYRNSTINQVVRNWQLQGVIIDSLVSNASLDVSFTIKSAPRWAIDSINKTIAITFLTAAGIPASAYSVKSAEQLNTCDDIYIMPHNDAVNWIKHRNLYFWNKNQKGSIWAGCLAASLLENVYKDTTAGLESPGQTSGRISMNFLTNNGLILWSNHNEKPVLPFTNINTGDVMAQYIGIPDSAQLSGRETVYLPKLGGGWNSKSIVITYQPKQPDIPTLSAGVAAENVYGRAYGDSTRGFVMYQSSHDFGTSHNGDKKNGGNQGSGSWNNSLSTSQIVNNTAAQCIFFNFSFYSSVDKLRTILTASVSGTPTQMTAGTLYSGFTATTGGSASGITYSWKSSLPGTFSNPTGQTTSFTPSTVSKSSICAITCTVTDNCGRSVFDSKGGIIIVPGGVPFTANAISKSISSSCSSSALSFNVFDNNIDSNAGARTLTAVSGFSHGSVSFSSSGVVNYTANANYNGPDNATYTINNGTSSASASITISVGSIALFPATLNDSASVLEDSITVISVLANDKNNPSALNGNQLFIRDIISKPTKGYVYINSDGSLSYLSKKDASSGSGSDNFTYQTCNSSGFCSIGTVYITVIKDACTAGNYQRGANITGTVHSDTIYATADTYIYQNSTGTNYGPNTTFSFSGRTGTRTKKALINFGFNTSTIPSSATLNSSTLQLTFSGFTYSSSTTPFPATVYELKRNWTETGATWTNYAASTPWGTSGAASSGTDFIATPFAKSSAPTATKVSGDTMNIPVTSLVQDWRSGTNTCYGFLLVPTSNGTSTPTCNYHSINNTTNTRYKPKLILNYTTATSSFPCVNIPTTYNPIGYPDTSSTSSNTAKTINVLTNDANYYGNTNSVFAVSTPVHGTTSIVSGNVLYTPSGSYVGIDTFYYTLKDGTNNQTTLVSVRVNVTRVAPLINSDSACTNSGTAVTVSIGLNDSDPQGTLSSPSITVNPKFGSAVVSGNSIIYTPSAGFTGKDSLIYSRTGSVSSSCETALTDTAIVRIRIINQSPIALNDTGNTVTCVPVNVNLTQNDVDAEGTPVTVYLLTSPSHGTLTFKQTGIYTFTPATNFNGTDLFTYKIKDGSPDSLSSNTATVYFNVLGTPAPNNHPVAINDSNLTYINQDLQLDVLANDYDPDGFNLTVNISASGLLAPTHGTLHLENNGMITYTPNVNFIGTDSYQYQICDQHTNCSGSSALCATALVFVRVIANPISTSGTIWDDENNSAHTTFNNIYTIGEPGTNAGSSLYTFIVDSNNIVIDNSFVDHDGSYMMVNTPPVTSTLKLWLSSDYKNIGDNLTTSQLPYSWSYTTPAYYNYHSGTNDTTGYDFGINQFPSPTPYSFPLTLNPVSTIIIDSSKVLGTDGGVGYVVNIHYMYFPTNTTSFTINGTTYTSGTWPSSGVTVPKYTPIRILPNSGSVTPVITFKVVDNGGAESRDSNFVSIPLYKILTSGTIGGGGNTFCGSGTPSAMTSVADADGGRATIQYQWQSSTVSNFSSLVTDITGAISSTYSPSNTVSVTTYFRRKVYTTIDTALYSNIITITVNSLPAAPTATNGSRSGTGTVSISATPPSGCTIDWYANSSGGSALLSGNTSFTTPSIAYTTIYYAFARNTTTGCISAGTPVTATVTGTINPGVIGNDQSLCGSSVPDSIKNVTVSSGV